MCCDFVVTFTDVLNIYVSAIATTPSSTFCANIYSDLARGHPD